MVVTDRNSDSEPLGLFLLSVESGERRRLTSAQEKVFFDIQPAFSPDGGTLAFVREVAVGLRDIYLLTLSEDFQPIGEPKRLTFENRMTFRPVWTLAGHEIIFSSGQYLTQTYSGSRPPALASRSGWLLSEKMALIRQSLPTRNVWSTHASSMTRTSGVLKSLVLMERLARR